MPLMATDTGGGDFQLVPEGTHLAICDMVVDVGLQKTTYKGESKIMHKVYVRWELPHERMEFEKEGKTVEGPMVIGNFYTLSLGPKARLRADLESWRGKRFTPMELEGFDLFKLLGVGCQVTVTHSEDGKYANVRGVAGWPKALPMPQTTECPIVKYSPEDTEQYEDLPEWLRNKINSQAESRQEREIPGPFGEVPYDQDDPNLLDDDIPFMPLRIGP